MCDQNPDIGSVIENYVHSCDIVADKWRRTGDVHSCDIVADKWRRTGVLTFNGHQRINKKVTFERIREHLN